MLNRDFSNSTLNIIRATRPNIEAPAQQDYIGMIQQAGKDFNEGALTKQMIEEHPEDKARIRQMGGSAYADMLKEDELRAEKRQQELDDIAAQRDFQREMMDAQLKNSFALENMRHNNAMGLAQFKASLTPQNGGAFDPKAAMDLRKEWQAGQKNYYEVGDNYAKLQKAAQNPSAAGDISMVFSYMKMLDPGSVVREGEYANAQNAAGVPTRIVNAYNRMIDGTRLSDEQRTDFTNQARNLFEAQKQRYDKQKEFYTGIANASGINPQYVISDPFDFEQNPQGLASFQAPQGGLDVGATQTFNNGFTVTRVK